MPDVDEQYEERRAKLRESYLFAAAESQSDLKRQKTRMLFSIASALLSVIVGIASVSSFGKIEFWKPSSADVTALRRIEDLQQQLKNINERLEQLRSEVSSLPRLTQNDRGAEQNAILRQRLDSVSADVARLNSAIVENPEKALSVPLMRKDLEALKESSRRDLDSTRNDVNRVYDQNKWFIGLMFTMALSVLGLAVSNIVQARKASDRGVSAEGKTAN